MLTTLISLFSNFCASKDRIFKVGDIRVQSSCCNRSSECAYCHQQVAKLKKYPTCRACHLTHSNRNSGRTSPNEAIKTLNKVNNTV
jgi:hypothetical protein